MTNNVEGCQEIDVCTVHLVNILKSGLVMLIKNNVSGVGFTRGEAMLLGSQDALTPEANTIKDQELRYLASITFGL